MRIQGFYGNAVLMSKLQSFCFFLSILIKSLQQVGRFMSCDERLFSFMELVQLMQLLQGYCTPPPKKNKKQNPKTKQNKTIFNFNFYHNHMKQMPDILHGEKTLCKDLNYGSSFYEAWICKYHYSVKQSQTGFWIVSYCSLVLLYLTLLCRSGVNQEPGNIHYSYFTKRAIFTNHKAELLEIY